MLRSGPEVKSQSPTALFRRPPTGRSMPLVLRVLFSCARSSRRATEGDAGLGEEAVGGPVGPFVLLGDLANGRPGVVRPTHVAGEALAVGVVGPPVWAESRHVPALLLPNGARLRRGGGGDRRRGRTVRRRPFPTGGVRSSRPDRAAARGSGSCPCFPTCGPYWWPWVRPVRRRPGRERSAGPPGKARARACPQARRETASGLRRCPPQAGLPHGLSHGPLTPWLAYGALDGVGALAGPGWEDELVGGVVRVEQARQAFEEPVGACAPGGGGDVAVGGTGGEVQGAGSAGGAEGAPHAVGVPGGHGVAGAAERYLASIAATCSNIRISNGWPIAREVESGCPISPRTVVMAHPQDAAAARSIWRTPCTPTPVN